MEKGRRSAAFRERERTRQQKGKKFDRLIDRATEKGSPFTDPEMGSGRRVTENGLRISSSVLPNGEYSTHYREVMEGGSAVFLSRATFQGEIQNSSQVLRIQSGAWERVVKRLANNHVSV